MIARKMRQTWARERSQRAMKSLFGVAVERTRARMKIALNNYTK